MRGQPHWSILVGRALDAWRADSTVLGAPHTSPRPSFRGARPTRSQRVGRASPEPIPHLARSPMDSGPEPSVGPRRPKAHPGMTAGKMVRHRSYARDASCVHAIAACGERSDRRGEAELRQGDPGEGASQRARWQYLSTPTPNRCSTLTSSAPRLLKVPLTRNSLTRISTSPRKRGEVK